MEPRLFRAINVAAWAHAGQMRKGTEIPYISHPFAVMHLVSQQPGVDEDTVIAALLHDVLEDVPERYSQEDMVRDFGSVVTSYVQMVSKDKSLPSWQERADDYLIRLRSAPFSALVIIACDKFHNLGSIMADYEKHGEALWDRFNSGKQSQHWWYQTVYETLEERLREMPTAELPILEEYRKLVDEFEKTLSGGASRQD
ncbi:HD domain-containing protein [Corynebacterium casei]|uniref:Guanosine-3',5'-bis(Diphosphate) 3'-pyrophosphohydrolase n=2 Tax=Corynebacterium casei TaxID=160386 RepID=A0ABM5PQE4_9CORY|nr:HD domain-containing protein [Corynebacterium casei]AHI20189.1 Guanosine-3',5'-bis(diphosphate) 3'-pyrophosphohydrolase [Corynebacterium casei LMG S-19264]